MRIYPIMKKCSVFLILLITPFSLFADISIGEASTNLMTPVSFVTKLALLSCYIIGIALVLASIAQYKIHRQSPKLVPLTTPITLLILGLTAIGIPYATNMFGDSYSAEQQHPTERKSSGLVLPDINSNKGPSLPSAPAPRRDNEPAPPPAAVEPPPSSGGGHWTDDPQYNR